MSEYGNCGEQVAGFDQAIAAKDSEIDSLRARVAELEAAAGSVPAATAPTPLRVHCLPASRVGVMPPPSSRVTPLARRGKAPPVNEFSGEDPECLLEDWLPSLERASLWNAWSEEEQMIQLAGYLRGRALQEWNLLRPDQRATYAQATESLRSRLDSIGRTAAAQDFRHAAQREEEPVSDFIRRIERIFRSAYGRDPMSSETRETLLYGQLQEGLRLQLMRGPAVSGGRNYQELCVAARNEEKRLADLRKRQEYSKLLANTSSSQRTVRLKPPADSGPSRGGLTSPSTTLQATMRPSFKCFYCHKTGHRKEDCRRRKKDLAESESRGPSRPLAATKQVRAGEDSSHSTQSEEDSTRRECSTRPASPSTPLPVEIQEPDTADESPLSLLFSDSEDESVKQIRVEDNGSHPQLARVDVHGVPADGIIDTAADITIMGGKLFALIATAAKLRKRNFRKPDKVPRNYDGREFRLDGCMEMDITFHEKTITTTVYIKMDAVDQLLLSEGVCRQLGIVMYHTSVVPRKTTRPKVATVPSIKVSLVQSLKLPPSQCALVQVKLESPTTVRDQMLLIEGEHLLGDTGLILESAVVDTSRKGTTHLVITNMSGLTQRISEGTIVGEAQAAEVITPEAGGTGAPLVDVQKLTSAQDEDRRRTLMELLPLRHVPQTDTEQLRTFLANNHDAFSLEEGERGETSLVTDTGDANNHHDVCRSWFGKR